VPYLIDRQYINQNFVGQRMRKILVAILAISFITYLIYWQYTNQNFVLQQFEETLVD